MKKILIVDDSALMRTSIERVLEGEGDYIFLNAWNGYMALELIKITTPDLILLDNFMPCKLGLQVYNIIRRTKKYKNIPVIFITNEVDKNKLINLNKVEFVGKPYEDINLIQLVKKYLKGGK